MSDIGATSPGRPWARAIKEKVKNGEFADHLEMRPSNRAVVHHSGAFVVDLPEGVELRDGRAYGPDGKELDSSRVDSQDLTKKAKTTTQQQQR